jgi:hypothetical protein
MLARTATATALAALVLATAAAPARADGHYFSFGVGGTQVDDELAVATDGGARIRMAVGHRFGSLAVEGFLAPEFFDTSEGRSLDGVGLGVDVRYIVNLTGGVQGYVRGSASRLSLHDHDSDGASTFPVDERSGRGLGGGVGLQLRGKVRALGFLYWPFFFLPLGPRTNAALYVDHGVDFYRLHDASGRTDAVDAKLTRFTIGFNVGQDF